MTDSFARMFLDQTARIAIALDEGPIDAMAEGIAAARDRGGRLFILGVGGGAGNAGHAVNDFRKLCDVEAYAPTDNVSELTARTNDEGWDTVFSAWLAGSRANAKDAVLVFSVGGGSVERQVSMNLVRALDFASERGLAIYAVIGRSDGHAARLASAAVIVPSVDPDLVTPHAEAYQSVVWHCLVSHPRLKKRPTVW